MIRRISRSKPWQYMPHLQHLLRWKCITVTEECTYMIVFIYIYNHFITRRLQIQSFAGLVIKASTFLKDPVTDWKVKGIPQGEWIIKLKTKHNDIENISKKKTILKSWRRSTIRFNTTVNNVDAHSLMFKRRMNKKGLMPYTYWARGRENTLTNLMKCTYSCIKPSVLAGGF